MRLPDALPGIAAALIAPFVDGAVDEAIARELGAVTTEAFDFPLPGLPGSPTPPVPARADTAPVVPPPAPPPRATRPKPAPLTELDRRGRQRIARGRVDIERRIDLHGMTQAVAHAMLRGFLRQAQADDVRLVLVVTGKGERLRVRDGETGVLKRLVPHWLGNLDLRDIVLGFEPAGIAHGGSGALYIRLRRRRDR